MSIYKGNKKVIALYKGATPVKSIIKKGIFIFDSEDTGTTTNTCALSCDTDKTIPMQKFYINWYEDIDQPGYHFIGFSTSPEEDGDCYDCDWGSSGIYICPSENSYMRPDGEEGRISDLPMEGDYYVLDMGETVYFKCGEINALFDHVFYCEPNIVDGSIVTENTLSFKYEINGILTKSNISINGTSYSFDATNGESLGDGFYKATITPTEKITTFKFVNGNVCELYAIPNKLTDMSYMFDGCVSLTNINLSGLDMTDILDLQRIFNGLVLFTGEPNIVINVSGWNLPDYFMQNGSYNKMFYNSTAIKTLILGEVTQTEYNWWIGRLTQSSIQEQVTIDCTIV